MIPQLEFLLDFILRNYFNDSSCLLIASTNFTYSGLLPSVNLLINNDSFDADLICNRHYGCQGILIQNENPAPIFQQFENQIRLNNDRFNKRKYLIIQEDSSFDFFHLKGLNFVTDLLVISEVDGNFDLRTHQYVGATNHNTPILVDRFYSNVTFLYGGNNLYPDKISNQQGRALKLATIIYEPYSIVGDSIENSHGSELKIVVEFALKYNMTPVFVVNTQDYWGTLFPNWSGNGLLGNLVHDKADVGFAALYTWEICYFYLDLSKPAIRTAVTCLVPAPKSTPGWLTPLHSYSLELWLCVIVTSILAALTIIVSLFTKTNPKNMLSTAVFLIYKPLLLQPLPKAEIPKGTSIKIMLAAVLVMTFFLTTSYNSGLASIMTIPRYEAAIDSVEAFAESELFWGATQDAWTTSIQNSTDRNHRKIVRKFIPLSEEELRVRSLSDNFAFSIERLPFDDYAIGSYIKEDVINNFHLMQQDFYWEQCVLMLRKNSILLPYLDDFILKLVEVGLISQWQRKAVNLYMDPHVQKAVKYYQKTHVGDHRVVKLKWTHVEEICVKRFAKDIRVFIKHIKDLFKHFNFNK